MRCRLALCLWCLGLGSWSVAQEAGDAPPADAAVAPAPAAEAAGEFDVRQEIEALRQENQALKSRLDAVESLYQTEPAGDEPPEDAPTGRFPLGSDTTFKIKGDIRLRNEQLFNAFDFSNATDDNWNSTRLRTRLAIDVDYKKLVGGFVQLRNEFRWGSNTKYTAGADYENKDAQSVRIDQAYFRLAHPWDVPFVLTAGRQDLLANPEKGWRGWYGEAWLLFDGTPQDGSATIAFDSAKLRFDGIEDTTIDVIYAKLSDRNIGAERGLGNLYATDDFDEDLAAAYAITNLDVVIPSQLDLYVLYKHKNIEANYNPGNPFIDPKMYTLALGGRLATRERLLDKHLSMAFEGAYQTGDLWTGDEGLIAQTPYPANDEIRRDAYGAYVWATLHLDQEMPDFNPSLMARFDFMSGDDPDTQDKFEGWDSMYGEWPKYSELLIYNLYDPFSTAHGTADPNLGAFTNMMFPSVELSVTPSFYPLDKRLTLKAGYRYMMADEKNGPGDGRELGHLVQAYAQYALVPGAVITHFYFDYFLVGDYYGPGADDAWFSRFEVMFVF